MIIYVLFLLFHFTSPLFRIFQFLLFDLLLDFSAFFVIIDEEPFNVRLGLLEMVGYLEGPSPIFEPCVTEVLIQLLHVALRNICVSVSGFTVLQVELREFLSGDLNWQIINTELLAGFVIIKLDCMSMLPLR